MIKSYLKLPILLLLLIIIAGCSTVSGPLGDREDATPWNSLYFNTARVGHSPDALEPPFEKKWSHKIKAFEFFKPYPRVQLSVPVMAEGMLFIGSINKNFYAYDFSSGSRIWEYEADSPIESTATVTSKEVCFGTSNGVLHCLDSATGEPLWTFKTDSEIISSPIITENSVYLYASSDRLFALNPTSGREVWSYRRTDYNMVSPRVRSSPALSPDGEKIFQVFSDGSLVCFEAFTGKVLWEVKLYRTDMSSPVFRRTPAVVGDTVFVPGKDLKVQARLVENGRLLKTYKGIKVQYFIPVDKDRLILASESEVALIDSKSGDVIWKKKSQTKDGKGSISAISVSGDTVLVLMNTVKRHFNLDFLTTRRGHLMALNIDNGTQSWKKKFSSTLSVGLSASGGNFALLTNDGEVQVWGR